MTNKKRTPKLIINEQHKILPNQLEVLGQEFPDIEEWDIVSVPASGWTKDEMEKKANELIPNSTIIVFVSPIPYMIKRLTILIHCYAELQYWEIIVEPLIFHNDKRIKKELPNGKIIHTVAETGWQLV